MEQLKVALLQMDIVLGEPEANRERVRRLSTSLGGHDLVLLPELWSTGYDLDRATELAEDLTGPSVLAMVELAAKCKGMVGGSILLRRAQGIANTFVLVNSDGNLLADYDKVHLFGLMREPEYLLPGQNLACLNTAFGRLGLAICYDLRFPELFRSYVIDGVDCILLVAEWPYPRLEHWLTLLRSRAIENQCYVVACNRVGADASNSFFGHSLVVSPWGEVIAQGDDQEQVIKAVLTKSSLQEARTRLPVLADRRPDTYDSRLTRTT